MIPLLDRRPVIVAVAGPNGAGKTTFYHSHLRDTGLRFINADVLAGELNVDAYTAARIAGSLRLEFVAQRESFVFETVLSDPAGEKIAFLRQACDAGYNVILCFIGIAGPNVSGRFPRTMANLKAAVRQLPCVWVFDNGDLRTPFRLAAVFENGRPTRLHKPLPKWLRPLIT